MYRLYVLEDAQPIMPGVAREEYHAMTVRDFAVWSPEGRKIVGYEDEDGVKGYVSVGNDPDSFPRVAVHDGFRWFVHPGPANDDHRRRRA